ncbi:E3 ubiquitin-protein ligase rnf4 [Bulinus truncatus]|nr:E3 ubiquitin-protein ligase rnf4 [Bulinus truncatus]
MASYSSSRGRSSRLTRRNRTDLATNSVHSIDDGDNQLETTCIDLTEDSPTDHVIDLTRGYSIIDSPVVVLTPTDNIGPVRQRGSGRNGRRRSRTTRSRRLNTISVPEVHILHSDESSDELPDVPFELPRNVIAANESILSSPAGVKISCPICLDDVKQIQRSNRQVISTMCGHIFCDVCINAAIASQNCCPSCRKRLTSRSIHPLFL